MRAAWYSKNGEASQVLETGELSTPIPGPSEVRVRLAVSGVNPSDVKSRRGRPLQCDRVVPHSDGAGIIDMVGAGVAPARVGERVWLWNGQWGRDMGTAAEYIVLPETQAIHLPDNIEFAAGACLGIPAMTAFRAVELLGDVSDKTVLVIGASNAVGDYAAQMALIKGARVIGTVGSDIKAAHAKAIGVDATINYKRESIAARVKELTKKQGVNVVIDMDFTNTAQLLTERVLAPHAKVISYGSNVMGDVVIPFWPLLSNSISLHFLLVYDLLPADRRVTLDGLTRLLNANQLRHTIGARFGLDDIAAAHEAVEGGKVLGNIVVDLPQ